MQVLLVYICNLSEYKLSPHKFVQNTLHPHVHSKKAEPVSPEHVQEIYNKPITLFKCELLSIKDCHFRRDFFPLRNP